MKQTAKDLLKINAVKLSPKEPFTWASGIKSPIYCDNRLTISYPEIRTRIAKGIAEIIKEKFPETEMIAGTATAGIPHAAWIAQELNLPMVYVRSKPKDHGRGKQIEGVLEKGQKTIVIDDLLSTGGSVLKAVFQRTSIPVKNRADAEQSFDCRKRVDFFQLPGSRAGIRSIAACLSYEIK